MTDERADIFRNYEPDPVLPQPFEGIKGTTEEGNVLLANAAMRILVGKLTERLRRAYLFGGPSGHPQYEAMTKVQPGDLVMVVDAFRDLYRGANTPEETLQQAVGYFVGERQEWGSSDEDWAVFKAQPGNEEVTDANRRIEYHAIYIQYGNDAICRWTNCDLVKVII